MTPETHLFLTAVAVHRELSPALAGMPDHQRIIRQAFGTPEGDLDFIRSKFEERDHPDMVDINAAAAFAWLPADALPTIVDITGACR